MSRTIKKITNELNLIIKQFAATEDYDATLNQLEAVFDEETGNILGHEIARCGQGTDITLYMDLLTKLCMHECIYGNANVNAKRIFALLGKQNKNSLSFGHYLVRYQEKKSVEQFLDSLKCFYSAAPAAESLLSLFNAEDLGGSTFGHLLSDLSKQYLNLLELLTDKLDSAACIIELIAKQNENLTSVSDRIITHNNSSIPHYLNLLELCVSNKAAQQVCDFISKEDSEGNTVMHRICHALYLQESYGVLRLVKSLQNTLGSRCVFDLLCKKDFKGNSFSLLLVGLYIKEAVSSERQAYAIEILDFFETLMADLGTAVVYELLSSQAHFMQARISSHIIRSQHVLQAFTRFLDIFRKDIGAKASLKLLKQMDIETQTLAILLARSAKTEVFVLFFDYLTSLRQEVGAKAIYDLISYQNTYGRTLSHEGTNRDKVEKTLDFLESLSLDTALGSKPILKFLGMKSRKGDVPAQSIVFSTYDARGQSSAKKFLGLLNQFLNDAEDAELIYKILTECCVDENGYEEWSTRNIAIRIVAHCCEAPSLTLDLLELVASLKMYLGEEKIHRLLTVYPIRILKDRQRNSWYLESNIVDYILDPPAHRIPAPEVQRELIRLNVLSNEELCSAGVDNLSMLRKVINETSRLVNKVTTGLGWSTADGAGEIVAHNADSSSQNDSEVGSASQQAKLFKPTAKPKSTKHEVELTELPTANM